MPIRKLLSLFKPNQSERWPEETLSMQQQKQQSSDFHTQLIAISDPQTAFKLCQQGASNGVIDAIYQLGIHYEKGEAAHRSLQEAEICYWRAASQGKQEAQYNLACLYARGALGRPDQITAFHWFDKAAHSGLASAQHQLSLCYEQGLGCLQNKLKAFEWTMKAAEQGITDSWQRLASMYFQGEGTEQSIPNAYAWAMLVKKVDDALHKSTDNILNHPLTPEQTEAVVVALDILMTQHHLLLNENSTLSLMRAESNHE